MSDWKKEIVPTAVDPAPVSNINAVRDLMKLDHVPRELIDNPPPTVIVVQQSEDRPGYRGDDLLRRFVPYFVIAGMLVILLGGIGLIMAMLLPMIIAAIGALVSIILSLVVTVIAGVVIALGIGYLQTINAQHGKIGKR